MSFFSRGSNKGGNRGNIGRRGRMPNVFWQQGRHKRMRFSIHFDADSDEFNQLVQIGYLNLGGQPALPQPPAPPSAPLQPHPSIMDFPEPPVQPVNDGWDNNPVNPPSSITQWPVNPPLPPHTTPFVTSTASIAHSPPKDHRVPSHEIQMDKGKKPITSPSTNASQSSSVHSKQQSTKEESGKREVSFSDMHPEINKYEEKKVYYEDILNIRPDVSEGRKEREEYFKKKYPHLF
jgi:hypothetical protein